MKILMLGNSFTYYNDLPQTLAALTGASVTARTRPNISLAGFLDPATRVGGKTLQVLKEENWDFVVLQEMSNGPITARDSFFDSVRRLCALARENGATPVLYATWAYRPGAAQYSEVDMGYEEMADALSAAYREAARENGALVADVGARFREVSAGGDMGALYAEDGSHPSEAGSRLAAETLADVLLGTWEGDS